MKKKFTAKKAAAKRKSSPAKSSPAAAAPAGASADLAETLPMTDSQVQLAVETLAESQLCDEPDVDLAMHGQENSQEDEQGEEEQLTDDELVTPILSHDRAGYDDIKSPAAAGDTNTGEDAATGGPQTEQPGKPVRVVEVPEFPPDWPSEGEDGEKPKPDSVHAEEPVVPSPGAEYVQESGDEGKPTDPTEDTGASKQLQLKEGKTGEESEETKAEKDTKGTFKERHRGLC